MFDIREYYNSSNYGQQGIESDILEIGNDIVSEIDDIIINRSENLYLTDRYKTGGHLIDIIYPAAGYPGPQIFVPSPDRIRFFLSFYPYKEDFRKIDRIVLRPRYIEAGNIELAALYIKKQKALILYLTHPASYGISNSKDENSRFISISIENLMDNKIIEDTINKSNKVTEKGGNRIPSLWDIISLVDPHGEGVMDKFFIKSPEPDSKIFQALTDISHFYSSRGY